jgi:hypothetical protein
VTIPSNARLNPKFFFSNPVPTDPVEKKRKGGNVKFRLRCITVSIAALFLTMGTVAYGQTADNHPVAGRYSIVNVENVDSQHVKLSLHLRLLNRTSGDVELANFAFHPTFPVLISRRIPSPQLQTVASSLAMLSRSRVDLTKDVVMSKSEYLRNLHERRLLFQATIQAPDGTIQTQNVVLHADSFKGVK